MKPAFLFLLIALAILPATGCCLFDGACGHGCGLCGTPTCSNCTSGTCPSVCYDAPPYTAPSPGP